MSDTKHKSVFEALFAVQQNLPHVGKDSTADLGKFKYKYADLNAVQDALFPLFKENELVWFATGTIVDDTFALAYQLTHYPTGTAIQGTYLLPKSAPQEIGSALTYARRYALCAVTGLAPGGDDDDGAKASTSATTEVDPIAVLEWVAELKGAETLPALQAKWEAAGKSGVTRDPRVIAAKDARKKQLA